MRGRLDQVFPRSQLDEDDSFWVTVRVKGRNSWRPWIEGEIAPANGGTLIETRFPTYMLVVVFTLVHGIPFLGLSWLIGIAAYLWGVSQVKGPFVEQLDITLEGDEARRHAAAQAVAEPESEGAAGAAPVVFRAEAGVDGASFRLAEGRLQVRGGGIQFDEEKLGWDQIRLVSGRGSTLVVVLEDGELREYECGKAQPDEVKWLARYLQARNQRWTTPEERREAEAKARAQLERLGR